MDSDRLNLTALDPSADPECWERMIASITDRASAELARRAESGSPLILLAGWTRPMLAAAAVLAVLSTAALRMVSAVEPNAVSSTAAATAVPGLVEVLRVPAPAAGWLAEERAPTLDDLFIAMEGDAP